MGLADYINAGRILREGKAHYWKGREADKQRWRQEAQKQDCYYDPITGSMNDKFYSDGSLKFDVTTHLRYEKGQYYCRADGVNARYQMTDPKVPRPPKK